MTQYALFLYRLLLKYFCFQSSVVQEEKKQHGWVFKNDIQYVQTFIYIL